MSKVTIAVSGIASPMGQSIIRAAIASNAEYHIIGMDVDPFAQYIFDGVKFIQSPHINDEDYLNKIVDIFNKEDVDLYYPGAEREMLGLLELKQEVEERTSAKIAIGSEASLVSGMDKLSTAQLLEKAGLPFPRTKELKGDIDELKAFVAEIGYPCIVKGKRSGPPYVIKSEEDLMYHYRTYNKGVIQEFLGDENSKEYTVGVFFTPEYGATSVFMLERELKYGLTWRAKIIYNEDIKETCLKAVEALAPLGSVNVQLRYHNNVPVVHEFNVRCSSSTVFRSYSGWNEIDMAVDYFLNNKKPQDPKVEEGYAIRFFDEKWVKK